MLPEYAALPGSEPRPLHGVAAAERGDQAAAARRPSCRALGAGSALLVLAAVAAVLCSANTQIGRRAASSLSWALAERGASQQAAPSPASAVGSAIAFVHDALKRQRYSITAQYAGDLPTEMADCMNFSTDPCSNFYEYACGSWVAGARIPADDSSFQRTWDGTEQTVSDELAEILSRQWPEDSPFRRLNEWHDACMDVDAIEALASAPLQPVLQRIDALQTVEELRALMVEFVAGPEVGPNPFKMWISLSVRDNQRNSLFMEGAGLTMPDPGWYGIPLDNSAMGYQDMISAQYSNDQLQEGQQRAMQYFRRLNELAGSSPDEAALIAEQTMAFETELAQWRLDEPAILEPMGPELTSLSDLESLCPGVAWTEIFQKISNSCNDFGYACNEELLADEKLIVMTAPYFYQQMSASMMNETMLNSSWKPFLRTHYIGLNADLLSKDFVKVSGSLARWASGQEDISSRPHKCSEETRSALSALTDIAFVENYFPNKTQTQAKCLLNHIKESYIEMLSSVEWMDEETREKALEKMGNLGMHIGGSTNYKQLVYPVTNASYYNNSRWSDFCHMLRGFMELGQAPNSSCWSYPAHMVNAWYDNGQNALFIPAGILQPPFFSAEYPVEQNFGSMGMLMAHEITHGFDTKGSRFDQDRQLHEWWTKPSRERFQARAHCIRRLYDQFEVAGENVKGRNTLAENIADFGGLAVAYSAYLSWYNQTLGGEPPLSSKRLFFTAYGQNWCSKARPDHLRHSSITDEHAPWAFRANGVVSQNPDFAKAFECPRGSPMNPLHRCVMWSDTPGDSSGLSPAAQRTPWQRFEAEIHRKRQGRVSSALPSWDS